MRHTANPLEMAKTTTPVSLVLKNTVSTTPAGTAVMLDELEAGGCYRILFRMVPTKGLTTKLVI